MGRKFFVWSFDDGLEQDKKIVEILRSYHMGATFNLNSGLYGKQQMIGRIGTLGCKEVPLDKFQGQKFHILKYVPHRRIPEDELRQVYEGFEIASHTTTHQNLTKLTAQQIEKDIASDVQNLSKMFSQKVTGFAYPFGASNSITRQALQSCGITYARLGKSSDDFSFPKDPLSLPISCWHISSKAMDKLEHFLSAPAQEEDQLFLMFAHGYEFDFGMKESSWDKFKHICDRVSQHTEVICCSTAQAFEAHNMPT